MRSFVRSVAGKVTVFILFILMLVTTAGCVLGAVLLANYGFYTETREELIRNNTSGLFFTDCYDIANNLIPASSEYYPNAEYTWSQTNTNLRWQLLDPDGEIITGNIDDPNSPWLYNCHFRAGTQDGVITDLYYTNSQSAFVEENNDIYTIRAYVNNEFPVSDEYRLIAEVVDFGHTVRYAVYPAAVIALILAAVCCIVLLCVSARRPDSDELHPGALNRVPFDLLTAAAVFAVILGGCAIDAMWYDDIAVAISVCVLCVIALSFLMGLLMSMAARIKQHTLIKNNVIYICISFVFRILRAVVHGIVHIFSKLPLVWRTALAACAVMAIELIAIAACSWNIDSLLILWFLGKLITVPAVLLLAISLRNLQKAGEALAGGDLGYHADTKYLFWDFKRHAENLNSIGVGMTLAVDERTRSERMKTELITSVSHDIKTPLTSIINYVDLIAKEPAASEKTAEYSAVLLRQAERLRRLTDDLVEASKASTGNLEINLAPCEVGVLLTQTVGEYAERFIAAELEPVPSQPEEALYIMADGRRLWRVFDNLLGNICKYSQSGTRVYLTLAEVGGNAVITFRNVSRAQLNIHPDELVERFVRGDSSRSTDGSGLGLSIAKSLTELQGGKFDLIIDGDLFKVTLTFPIMH